MSGSQKFISRNRAPRVQIEYDVEVYGAQKKVQLPFVMGVMSDLSGKSEVPTGSVADRKFLEIDIDNFDNRMKAMKPRAAFSVPNTLTGEGNLSVDLVFEKMSDFSPAEIARKVEPLRKLLEARTQLSNLMTYMDGKAGAEELIERLVANPEQLRALALGAGKDEAQDAAFAAMKAAAPEVAPDPEDASDDILAAMAAVSPAAIPEDTSADVLSAMAATAPEPEAKADDAGDILAGMAAHVADAPAPDTAVNDALAGMVASAVDDAPEVDTSADVLADMAQAAPSEAATDTSVEDALAGMALEQPEVPEEKDNDADILTGLAESAPAAAAEDTGMDDTLAELAATADTPAPEDTAMDDALAALAEDVVDAPDVEDGVGDLLAEMAEEIVEVAPEDDLSGDILAGMAEETLEEAPEDTAVEDALAALAKDVVEASDEEDGVGDLLAEIAEETAAELLEDTAMDDALAGLAEGAAEVAPEDDISGDILAGMAEETPDETPEDTAVEDALAGLAEDVVDAPDEEDGVGELLAVMAEETVEDVLEDSGFDDVLNELAVDAPEDEAAADPAADILLDLAETAPEAEEEDNELDGLLADMAEAAPDDEGDDSDLDALLGDIADTPPENEAGVSDLDDLLEGLADGAPEAAEEDDGLDDLLADMALAEPDDTLEEEDDVLSGLLDEADEGDVDLDALLGGDEGNDDDDLDLDALLAVDDEAPDAELDALLADEGDDDLEALLGGDESGDDDLDLDALLGDAPDADEGDDELDALLGLDGDDDELDSLLAGADDAGDDDDLDLAALLADEDDAPEDDLDALLALDDDDDLDALLGDVSDADEGDDDLDALLALDEDAPEDDLESLLAGDDDGVDDLDALLGLDDDEPAAPPPKPKKPAFTPEFGSMSAAKLQFEAGARRKFRIAVLGDFSGRGNKGTLETGAALGARKAFKLDFDTMDDVIARFRTTLTLPLGNDGSAVEVALNELDDLHPDELFENVELFNELNMLRRDLKSGRNFEQNVARLKAWGGEFGDFKALSKKRSKGAEAPADLRLTDFQNLIGDSTPKPEASAASDLISRIIGPHIVAAADNGAEAMIAAVDAALSTAMSSVLHHPDFQAVEAAWRSIELLGRRVEASAELEVVVYDVSVEEFTADLAAEEDVSQSGLYDMLVEKPMQDESGGPISAVIGLYTWEETPTHAELLARMARISAQMDAPFISAISTGFMNVKPEDRHPLVKKTWDALANMPEAKYLGLASPRFMLRMPYGKKTEPLDRFDYEEFTVKEGMRSMLMANPALLVAVLLAETKARQGGDMSLGSIMSLNDMPFHYMTDQYGDQVALPCTERLLTVSSAAEVVARGFMPVLSVQGQNIVKLASFQAVGGGELLGIWAGDAAKEMKSGAARMEASVGISSAAKQVGAPPPKADPGASGAGEIGDDDLDLDLGGDDDDLDLDFGGDDLDLDLDLGLDDDDGMDALLAGFGDDDDDDDDDEMDAELAALLGDL